MVQYSCILSFSFIENGFFIVKIIESTKMSYKPPHKKSTMPLAADPVIPENTDANFPALGGTNAPPKTWGGRKFVELAQEWKDAREEEKVLEQMKKSEEESNAAFVLPTFRNIHRFVELEEENVKLKRDTDTWKVVEPRRRIKREKAEEDLDVKYPEPTEETVWNEVTHEHESCWDSHKH